MFPSHDPGGDNLGQIDDIVYFQKKLYKALNVPINRLEQEAQFSLGRSSEITRDELKFQKFISRLRTRFAKFFLDILRVQLQLKGVIVESDWDDMKNDIIIDYTKDNHFSELKEAELLRERLQTLDQISQYVGTYFSKDYVMKSVLGFSEEDVEKMQDDAQKNQERIDQMDDDEQQ